MKKFLLVITLIVLLSVLSLAETKVVSLDESIMKPAQIVVGDKQVYITEGTTVSIFSGTDYKFISKFGKKGEGPGEIQGSRRGNVSFSIIPMKDKVYLFNRNKVMYFSKKGKFLNEKRLASGFVRDLLPVNDNYVGRSMIRGKNRSMKTAINMFSKDLSTKKLFYGTEKSTERGSRFKHFMADNIFIIKTNKDKVYINDTKELLIKVLDKTGKKTGEIKYNFKLAKVTKQTKAEIKNYYKTDPTFKTFYDRIKNRIEVGNTYNAIKDFFIDKDTVYVQTYDKTENGVKFLIFNTSGKFIKEIVLPLKSINIFDFFPYYIKNNTLYQIVENEDEEEWELHISKI